MSRDKVRYSEMEKWLDTDTHVPIKHKVRQVDDRGFLIEFLEDTEFKTGEMVNVYLEVRGSLSVREVPL